MNRAKDSAGKFCEIISFVVFWPNKIGRASQSRALIILVRNNENHLAGFAAAGSLGYSLASTALESAGCIVGSP